MTVTVKLDAPLEEPANPTKTPNPSKAPWYFLGLQEMLVYFDPWHAGVVLPTLIIVGLMVIPFIDTNPRGNGYYCYKDRKWEILTFIFGFHVLWVVMIIIGTFFRGPGWNLFWPWQRWDAHKVVALTNVDLPLRESATTGRHTLRPAAIALISSSACCRSTGLSSRSRQRVSDCWGWCDSPSRRDSFRCRCWRRCYAWRSMSRLGYAVVNI
jgi:hypothetical protein